MTSFLTHDPVTTPLQFSNYLSAGQARQPRHIRSHANHVEAYFKMRVFGALFFCAKHCRLFDILERFLKGLSLTVAAFKGGVRHHIPAVAIALYDNREGRLF